MDSPWRTWARSPVCYKSASWNREVPPSANAPAQTVRGGSRGFPLHLCHSVATIAEVSLDAPLQAAFRPCSVDGVAGSVPPAFGSGGLETSWNAGNAVRGRAHRKTPPLPSDFRPVLEEQWDGQRVGPRSALVTGRPVCPIRLVPHRSTETYAIRRLVSIWTWSVRRSGIGSVSACPRRALVTRSRVLISRERIINSTCQT